MTALKVDGAELYYEMVGAGPPLVLIAGAQGSAMVFSAVAQQLADHFTVVTYDRRGFSRSTLDGEQDYAHRLETDAADVAALIDHVGKGPAAVFGNSSGAIVALTVLARHPDVLRTLIAHEPPAARFLPDPEATIAANYRIYDKYRADGIPAAMRDFLALWLPLDTSDRVVFQHMASAEIPPPVVRNMTYWFEHELRQYPAVRLDLAALRQHRDRLLLAMGDEMHGAPTTVIIEALARDLDVPLDEMPGGHVGYAVHPAAFAAKLTAMLAGRGAAD